METYKKSLIEEVEEFRKVGHQFLSGEISRAEFKGKSGGMGTYSQKSGTEFMIRLRTPCGIIEKEHLQLILGYAEKYQLDKIHITTRQAVQLHDLKWDDICDIMKDAIVHNLFTRGGGGNYPRNVALAPLSGIEKGEAFDATPFALQVSDYFIKRAPEYHLPRKLKVAFSNSKADGACATLNDMGFVAVIENGTPMFQLYLAGGLGGGPALGLLYPELIKPEEVLYCVEAMIQLFMAEGDYENKAKARTRFIPKRMGEEAFFQCFREYLEQAKKENQFEAKTAELEKEEHWKPEIEESHYCIPQKQKDFYTVILHPVCGQMSVEGWSVLYNFIKEIEICQVRISMSEDMYVRNLSKEQAVELLKIMEPFTENSKVGCTISCVGTPTCQMGIQKSQMLCHAILERLEESQTSKKWLPSWNVSGCPNSCARHQVSPFGFVGKKVRVGEEMQDAFDIWLGGNVQVGATKMGEKAGTMLADTIPDFVVELGNYLEKEQIDAMELLKKDKNRILKIAEPFFVSK